MLSQLVARSLPLVPGPIMRRLSKRYIAGESLEEALASLEQLRDEGYSGILDILGEEISSEARARRVAEDYCEAAKALAQRKLDAYVSIKPTHVGLELSEELCFELYSNVARCCARLGLFLRVEMEDHTTTDATLRVFERLRAEFSAVGCVLQSRLLRTPNDIATLSEGPLDVRLVKGIYLEPAKVAHTEAPAIREAFLANAQQLLERGAHVRFATHDADAADEFAQYVAARGLTKSQYEFQVLLGVQKPLWERLKADGHPVRVYVPYGPDWRAYSTRRLSRNPEIVKHVFLNMFRA